MKKILNFAFAYILWIVDIGLALLLFLRIRTLLLDVLLLFYKAGNWIYAQRMNLVDRVFVVITGLIWLVFMIVVEEYFRTGVLRGDLLKRFAGITAPALLSVFIIDLILSRIQKIGSADWLHWLILAVELGAGAGLLVLFKTRSASKST